MIHKTLPPSGYVAIVRTDGGVSIMSVFVPRKFIPVEIEKWKTNHPGEYVSHREIQGVPSDKYFRAAWQMKDGEIVVDRPRAEKVQVDRIRAVRNAALVSLDKEIAKVEDRGGDAKAMRTERQRLRDIPQTLDLSTARSLDDLKAVWPAGLPRE